MNNASWSLFLSSGFIVALLFVCGLYFILVTRNMIRAIIGLELLIKGVTLLLVVCGYVSGKTALAQAFVITVIVIEVVIAVVAGGIAVSVYRCNNSIDARELTKLKG